MNPTEIEAAFTRRFIATRTRLMAHRWLLEETLGDHRWGGRAPDPIILSPREYARWTAAGIIPG